jgi:hypothetical protein
VGHEDGAVLLSPTIIPHPLSGFDLFATVEYECTFVENLEEFDGDCVFYGLKTFTGV